MCPPFPSGRQGPTQEGHAAEGGRAGAAGGGRARVAARHPAVQRRSHGCAGGARLPSWDPNSYFK